MSTFAKVLMYVVSSFVIFVVGLAVYNRIAPRVPILKTMTGA